MSETLMQDNSLKQEADQMMEGLEADAIALKETYDFALSSIRTTIDGINRDIASGVFDDTTEEVSLQDLATAFANDTLHGLRDETINKYLDELQNEKVFSAEQILEFNGYLAAARAKNPVVEAETPAVTVTNPVPETVEPGLIQPNTGDFIVEGSFDDSITAEPAVEVPAVDPELAALDAYALLDKIEEHLKQYAAEHDGNIYDVYSSPDAELKELLNALETVVKTTSTRKGDDPEADWDFMLNYEYKGIFLEHASEEDFRKDINSVQLQLVEQPAADNLNVPADNETQPLPESFEQRLSKLDKAGLFNEVEILLQECLIDTGSVLGVINPATEYAEYAGKYKEINRTLMDITEKESVSDGSELSKGINSNEKVLRSLFAKYATDADKEVLKALKPIPDETVTDPATDPAEPVVEPTVETIVPPITNEQEAEAIRNRFTKRINDVKSHFEKFDTLVIINDIYKEQLRASHYDPEFDNTVTGQVLQQMMAEHQKPEAKKTPAQEAAELIASLIPQETAKPVEASVETEKEKFDRMVAEELKQIRAKLKNAIKNNPDSEELELIDFMFSKSKKAYSGKKSETPFYESPIARAYTAAIKDAIIEKKIKENKLSSTKLDALQNMEVNNEVKAYLKDLDKKTEKDAGGSTRKAQAKGVLKNLRKARSLRK